MDKFFGSILQTTTEEEIEGGVLTEKTNQVAIVSDNPKVEAFAKIDGTLFSQDSSFREERLAHYIKRTFGAEGLRHLLGLIIGLEENFRQGHFEWRINEHLERLGYRKKTRGNYAPEAKKAATGIIQIFTSLFITATERKGTKKRIEARKFFSIDGFDIESDIFNNEIISETLILRATDFWYRHAFEPAGGSSSQYSKILKKIAQENHRNHPLTIYIAPLLAMFWRINTDNPQMRLKVPSLMEWCDLDTSGYKRTDHLKDLEGELDYMKNSGYLKFWENSGENIYPSKCPNPFECTLTLYPPDWLAQDLKRIGDKKEKHLILPEPDEKPPLLTNGELKILFYNLGVSQNQFANRLGISRQMVNYLLNNKRQISQELSDKIKEEFGYLLPM